VPVHPPGVYAYAENSIAAGETVHFHVSSDHDYQLTVYRLGVDPDSSALDVELRRFSPDPARVQPIHPGSYVHVARALPASQPLNALSVECWIRPWRTDVWQGLITQHRFPDACGFGLFVANGCAQVYLGNGGAFQSTALRAGPPIRARRWSHVVVTWNGRDASLYVDGVCSRTWAFTGPLVPGPAPLRLGAYGVVDAGGQPRTTQFLDGDLAMPVLYDRALDAAEVHGRFRVLPPAVPATPGVLACWPLTEERGSTVADVSGHARTGMIVNHASWMIGGPGFDPVGVPRYGSYDPQHDATRGHGLRFASDDLYDCAWSVTHSLTVPVDAAPGLYVGRIRVDDRVAYEVPFVVRRPLARARAPIVVLCATNTWLAYSAAFAGTGPGFSFYTTHEAGQPTFQLGLRMPMEAAGVRALYSETNVGYGHLVRAERFLHAWLEQSGYPYDMITDLDLHRDPGLLAGYQVLAIAGHSEYWSLTASRAVDDFLRAGGCAAVLSGNTAFWRVSFDGSGTVMECRKYDGGQDFGGQLDGLGELWHSHDFERGGMLRDIGHPCWKLLGLESAGMADTSDPDFIPFTVEDADHFLFRTPHATGAVNGGVIGQAPGGGLPRAVGHEWDARIIRLSGDPPPPGAVEPVEPPGITTLAIARKSDGWMGLFGRRQAGKPTIVSEIVYWERPQGGRVFYAGSIGTAWALAVDPSLQQLMHNVLHHFGVRPR
jgi:hypothetical protein